MLIFQSFCQFQFDIVSTIVGINVGIKGSNRYSINDVVDEAAINQIDRHYKMLKLELSSEEHFLRFTRPTGSSDI